jgi:hypothetical protein
MHCGRTRHRAVGTIHLGQQQGISRRVATRKGMCWRSVALVQVLAIQNACQQSCELGATVAAGGDQVAQHHTLVGSIQTTIAKTLGHRNDVGVAGLIRVGNTKLNLSRASQK